MGGQGTFDGCDQDLVKESTVAQLCKKFDVDETKLKSYLGRRGWTKTADQQRKSLKGKKGSSSKKYAWVPREEPAV